MSSPKKMCVRLCGGNTALKGVCIRISVCCITAGEQQHELTDCQSQGREEGGRMQTYPVRLRIFTERNVCFLNIFSP